MIQSTFELELLFDTVRNFPADKQIEIGQNILKSLEEKALPVISFTGDEQTAPNDLVYSSHEIVL